MVSDGQRPALDRLAANGAQLGALVDGWRGSTRDRRALEYDQSDPLCAVDLE